MGMRNRVAGKLAEVLAETDIDLIIAEIMRYIENAIIVIKATMSTGLPVWIGHSTMMAENGIDARRLHWENTDDTNGDHDFAETVENLTPLRAQATGIMHIQVDNIGPAPEVLGKHWSGPKLAYSETGRLVLPERLYEEVSSPQDYAAEVADWIKNYEIQIVGGGCGTDPERTRTLKNLITNLPE